MTLTKKNEANHFGATYLARLERINNIKFTIREIDVISFIISGRSAKSIASILAISSRTVENHIRNIMIRLGCSSRKDIIDFIEKSGKISFLRKHHSNLLMRVEFERILKNIAISKKENPTCSIIDCQSMINGDSSFIQQLESYLKLVKINVPTTNQQQNPSVTSLIHEKPEADHVIYFITAMFFKELQVELERESSQTHQISQKLTHHLKNVLFLVRGDKNSKVNSHKIIGLNYIDLNKQKNYFFCIFEILRTLLPLFDIKKILSDFREKYDHLESFSNSTFHPYLSENYANVYLTKREVECLWHLSHGKTSKEIGKLMDISQRTVEFYINDLKIKTGTKCKSQLIDIFMQNYPNK